MQIDSLIIWNANNYIPLTHFDLQSSDIFIKEPLVVVSAGLVIIFVVS